ncbi:MAG: PilZ domain-containing protein [Candidatus Omnitrophota bacterium]
MAEHRRFRRIPFREPSGIETSRFETFEGAAAYDLSCGGVRLRSQQFLALGTELRVCFQLRDHDQFIISGKVVWVQKEPFGDYYQFGIEFQNDPLYNFYRKCFEDCFEGRSSLKGVVLNGPRDK